MSDGSVLLDQKFGRWLARPFVSTPLRPNHITAIDLIIGVGSGVAIWLDHLIIGGVLFIAARLIDCVDGELARLQGTTSKFGENFDLMVGCATYLAFFVGLAMWSYNHASADHVTTLLIVVLSCVIVNTALLLVRQYLLHDHSEEFPTVGSVNLEDGAYLIPIGLWLGYPFETFAVVTIGAAIFVAWHSLLTVYRILIAITRRGRSDT